MKILVTILFLKALFITNVIAETFSIKGKVMGKEIFGYAYLFDNDAKLMDSVRILDNGFVFSGEIKLEQRFDTPPSVKILLSKTSVTLDEIMAERLLSNRKHFNCNVLLEKKIDLLYDSDRKMFTVTGSYLNQVQNLYVKEYGNYRNQRECLYESINNLKLSDQEKEKLKVTQAQRMFTKTMFRFIDIIKTNRRSKAGIYSFSPIIYDPGTTGKDVMDAFNLFSDSIKHSLHANYTDQWI